METQTWHEVSVTTNGEDGDGDTTLQVSQPNPILPNGFGVKPQYITEEDACRLIKIIDSHQWVCKGFEKRRREQYHKIQNDGSSTSVFDWIIDRIVQSTPHLGLLKRPDEIIVEERYPTAYIKGERAGRLTSSTFEASPMNQSEFCTCLEAQNGVDVNINKLSKRKCSCYVAQITLLDKCAQFIDKPKQRKVECWDVESPRHNYNFIMEPRTLFMKSGECLWNWRSRVATLHTETMINASCSAKNHFADSGDSFRSRVITIKFRSTHKKESLIIEKEEKKEELEIIERMKKAELGVDVTDKRTLEDLLTIVVTTSPIKSNPSTEVLERSFETFRHGGTEFAFQCPKVLICDGCRVLEEKKADGDGSSNASTRVTKKYANAKQSLRNGIATNDQAENYRLFKIAIRKICKDAEEDGSSPFHNTRVVELEERHGYGFALKHALYREVKTPFVCVIQHDRTFMRPTPMEEVVRTMINKRNGDIKYVGISMRSNVTYRDIFTSKYGKAAITELLDMVIYPPELTLDSKVYGPDGSSAREIEVRGRVKKNLDSLAKSYKACIQNRSHSCMNRNDGKHHLSLTPTLYWYDNIHVVETSHYRDFIFNPQYRMVSRGGFVEDKLSPLITKSVERLGLKDGHAKFKCYLLDDHSGYFFTGHLDGGSFASADEKEQLKKKNLE